MVVKLNCVKVEISPILETQNNCNWYFVEARSDESVITLGVAAVMEVVVKISEHL